MKVERKDGAVTATFDEAEVRLLKYALERALFIDTPVSEQMGIAAFCSRMLELLGERGQKKA